MSTVQEFGMPERLQRQLNEAREENMRLREALRGQCVWAGSVIAESNGHCLLCMAEWPGEQPERHAPGCLAAPAQREG